MRRTVSGWFPAPRAGGIASPATGRTDGTPPGDTSPQSIMACARVVRLSAFPLNGQPIFGALLEALTARPALGLQIPDPLPAGHHVVCRDRAGKPEGPATALRRVPFSDGTGRSRVRGHRVRGHRIGLEQPRDGSAPAPARRTSFVEPGLIVVCATGGRWSEVLLVPVADRCPRIPCYANRYFHGPYSRGITQLRRSADERCDIR